MKLRFYCMDFVALLSLLAIVGLMAWHYNFYSTCQAAPVQTTIDSDTPQPEGTPETGQPLVPPMENDQNTDANAVPPVIPPVEGNNNADGVTEATPTMEGDGSVPAPDEQTAPDQVTPGDQVDPGEDTPPQSTEAEQLT